MFSILVHASRGVRGRAPMYLAVWLAVCPALRSLPAQAARPPLTLSALLETLERSSPMLAAARAATDAASARTGPATALPDPRAQFAVMNRMLPGLGIMSPLAMDQLTITQMLPIATRRAAAHAAAVRVRVAERAVDVQRATLRRDATVMLADWWQADASRAVIDETRLLLTESVAAAEAMYRAGQAKQAEVLRMQAELTRMSAEWTSMDGMRRAAAGSLAAMLDAPLDPDSVNVSLPTAASQEDATATTAASADEHAAAARVAAARADEMVARRERWPELEVGLQFGQRPNSTERMVGVMAGASLPIFAKLRQQKMAEEATAMRRMSEADARAAAAAAHAGATEARSAVVRARALQRLYDGTLLPQLAAAHESATASYRAGTGALDGVLNAVMAVNGARMARVTAQADEVRALARLEFFTGQRLFAVASSTERKP